MKILHLTLKKAPFEVMITGEKNFEIRERSEWINSRLFNKDGSKKEYDVIKFTNGYGKDKPYFIAKFEGVERCLYMNQTFSNGFTLRFYDYIGKWGIVFGEIIERGNI